MVSEMCVQYVYEARINGLELKARLLQEWKRIGLPLSKANEACGVANVATCKYLDQGHLWYVPLPGMFVKMQEYANMYSNPTERPYFSLDGKRPGTAEQWAGMHAKFNCPHGFTNVWERNTLRDSERFKSHGASRKTVHLNQKPLDLVTMIINASSEKGDTACLAARNNGRRAFGAELDPTYFLYGMRRLVQESRQDRLPEC